ncbi:MAG: hypothetical protein LM583_10885 [Desulfurococcaceae archaeon]|nr:hypothetical protein [Desulfurococcaceae archaeon]
MSSQVPNQLNANQNQNFMVFEAPCCESARECAVRKLYVIGIRKTPRVLRTIDAVRCSRNVRKTIKFYPSGDVILVSYYRSNRGVNYITVLWKPQSITEQQAKEYAMVALGLLKEEVVM